MPVADRIKAEHAAIVGGKQLDAGPIVGTDGKERVAAGQVLPDAALRMMDRYVPGLTTQKQGMASPTAGRTERSGS